MIYQLDFWKTEEESRLDSIVKNVEAVKQSSDKVRKGIYARHGELYKKYVDLEERFQILERNICHGSPKIS